MEKNLASPLDKDSISSPDYIDEIPPFNILIRGSNEFGAVASSILSDVKLFNFGTTFSVDDLYTESTYNFVARHFTPFTNDWRQDITQQTLAKTLVKPLSSATMDTIKLIPSNIGSGVLAISNQVFSFFNSLPDIAKNTLKHNMAAVEENLASRFFNEL